MARRKKGPIDELKNSVGGFFGGTRGQLPSKGGIDDTGKNRSQTKWDDLGGAVYPDPRSIRDLPPQLAGYDDEYNVKGQIASTENTYIRGWADNTATFFNDIDTVYINPLYKREYIDSPETADRKEYKAETLAGLDRATQMFADANSKYFNKEFKVLPLPKRDSSNKFNGQYSNPMRTLQLDIVGDYRPTQKTLGSVSSRPFHQPGSKRGGVDRDQATSPYGHKIFINTAYNWRSESPEPKMFSTDHAFVMQHEFGHVLGFDHSASYQLGDKNTVMSYDNGVRGYGAKLLPSDINKYQEIYKKLEVQRKAKNAYKGVAKKRK